MDMVFMNLRMPFDMLISTFHTNLKEQKEDFKDYTFESFCGILIID
jgi:hypothetical protein